MPTTPTSLPPTGRAPKLDDRTERAFTHLAPSERWLVWQVQVLERDIEAVADELREDPAAVRATLHRSVVELRRWYRVERRR